LIISINPVALPSMVIIVSCIKKSVN